MRRRHRRRWHHRSRRPRRLAASLAAPLARPRRRKLPTVTSRLVPSSVRTICVELPILSVTTVSAVLESILTVRAASALSPGFLLRRLLPDGFKLIHCVEKSRAPRRRSSVISLSRVLSPSSSHPPRRSPASSNRRPVIFSPVPRVPQFHRSRLISRQIHASSRRDRRSIRPTTVSRPRRLARRLLPRSRDAIERAIFLIVTHCSTIDRSRDRRPRGTARAPPRSRSPSDR